MMLSCSRLVAGAFGAFSLFLMPQWVNAEVQTLEYTDGSGCNKDATEIKVTVENVRKDKGTIVADLHNENPEDFLRGSRALLRIRVPVVQAQQEFCIPVTGPGTYAVGIYHDRNDNWKFDKNFLGIPKEAFGLSKNPEYGLRKPKIEEAAFEVPEKGVAMVIQLTRARDVLN